MRWPIFSGGRIRANIRVQGARQEQALRQYEKQVLTALEDVENALSAHARERDRQVSLNAALAANRRALELATDRYTSGLESFLSVLDAQRSLYAAEDQLIRSDRTAGVTLIAIYKALGGGWAPDDSIRVKIHLSGIAYLLRDSWVVSRASTEIDAARAPLGSPSAAWRVGGRGLP